MIRVSLLLKKEMRREVIDQSPSRVSAIYQAPAHRAVAMDGARSNFELAYNTQADAPTPMGINIWMAMQQLTLTTHPKKLSRLILMRFTPTTTCPPSTTSPLRKNLRMLVRKMCLPNEFCSSRTWSHTATSGPRALGLWSTNSQRQ